MPFFVLMALFLMPLLFSYLGVNLIQHNSYVVLALSLIVLGLVLGIFALTVRQSVHFFWKLLIGLLYIPSTLFSLLVSGF